MERLARFKGVDICVTGLTCLGGNQGTVGCLPECQKDRSC